MPQILTVYSVLDTCALTEDSNRSVHPCSLNGVFAVCSVHFIKVGFEGVKITYACYHDKKIMCIFIQIASRGNSYNTHNISFFFFLFFLLFFFYGKVKKIICCCQIHTLSVALQSKQTLNGLVHVSSQDASTCTTKLKSTFVE